MKRRKIMSILLAAVLLFSTMLIGGCGTNGGESSTTDSGSASTSSTAEESSSAESKEETSTESTDTGTNDEQITLKLMHRFPDEPYQTFINKVCDLYMEENPNVTIEQISAATDPYKERLTVLMSNDDEAPDVFFGFTGEYLNQFIREDKVLDLTEYWNEDAEWADSYIESLMPSFWQDDSLYGVPFRVSVKLFYYNIDIFEELNLSIPQTWDELIDVCKALDEAGYIPIGEGDSDQWPATHYSAILNARCVSNDVRATDYAPETGEWTDSGYVDSLDYLMELSEYFSPNVTAQKHEMGRQQFAMGQAGMLFAESVEIPYIASAMEGSDPIQYGSFGFPTIDGAAGDQTAILGAPEGFSVSKATKNPDVAVDFLKFLCGQEVGKIEVEDVQWFNGCKDTVNLDEADPVLADCYNVITSAESVVNWMDNEIHSELRTIYYEDLQTLLNGDMTSEEFMQKIQNKAAEVKESF